MPGLGEKLYNKLINELLPTEKKIGNQTYDFEDKDRQNDFQNEIKKLQESWNAMALFFEGMANASTGNDSTLFSSAHQFCKDMAGAVGDSPEIEDGTVDNVKEAYENLNNYDDFDKALEVLFPETEEVLFPETDKPLFSLNEAEDPNLPKNSSYTQKIEYNQRKYNKLIQETKEKGRAIPIGIDGQLIKGIKGLQTYIKEGLAEDKIDNDLNEKIKHVEEVIQQPQKLESIYLGYLQDSLSKSHRLLGNSTEYGTMLENAQALYRDWEKTSDIERHRLAEAARSAAQEYITCKQGNNTNWSPITKEGKKRFALANSLLKTVTALLDEELTPRITKDIIDNNEDFIEIAPSVDKDKNKFINTNQKNNKNQEKNKIDQESSRQDRIKTEAETKLAGYSAFYMGTNVSAEIDDLVAKAVAVNVLKQIGINDTEKPEPNEIFTPTKIDTVAEAVKQTELFTKDRDRLEKMVFKEEDNVTMFTIMKPNDINDIINSNDFINSINKQEIKLGPPEAGPAKITSTQQEQDKNITDNKSIDNKSIDNKSIGKKL